jgi:hypothetical protein
MGVPQNFKDKLESSFNKLPNRSEVSDNLFKLQSKLSETKKEESKEATGAAGAGQFSGPLFGPMKKETKETKGEEFKKDPERTIQPREIDLDNVFGKYYREVPEDVIRYMRKNPALIFQRLYDAYGDKAYDYLDRAAFKKQDMFIKDIKEGEILKGGKADNKNLEDLVKKHRIPLVDIKKQLSKGIKTEMEHTENKSKAMEIAMDHLYEDPKYYDKLKKIETKEATGASSAGQYDAPFPGFVKDPLKIGGPDTIYKGRAVKDKKFPRYGGPGAKFVKIKEKCKKFPYCNQGDMNALELIDNSVKESIERASEKYGMDKSKIMDILLKELIFINK